MPARDIGLELTKSHLTGNVDISRQPRAAMTPWNAAKPGDALEQIDTPALILDLDAFERNLRRMATAVEGRGIRLRPHAKSHKCPQIALRQIALGAVGICCQKVSEAAVFVEAGVLVDHRRQVEALPARRACTAVLPMFGTAARQIKWRGSDLQSVF